MIVARSQQSGSHALAENDEASDACGDLSVSFIIGEERGQPLPQDDERPITRQQAYVYKHRLQRKDEQYTQQADEARRSGQVAWRCLVNSLVPRSVNYGAIVDGEQKSSVRMSTTSRQIAQSVLQVTRAGWGGRRQWAWLAERRISTRAFGAATSWRSMGSTSSSPRPCRSRSDRGSIVLHNRGLGGLCSLPPWTQGHFGLGPCSP